MRSVSRSEKWGVIIIILIVLFWVVIWSSRKTESMPARGGLAEKSFVLPTPVPPTPTITPTPTLTPEQIAEIRRKRFEDLNRKYGPCKYVPILLYHHVMDTTAAKAILATNLNVPPDVFREQMDYLSTKGYSVIGLDELVAGLNGNFAFPAKPVVLTFDDGYRDFYDIVLPILREKNLKATVFVISQFAGGERYVTWDQLREMGSSGLVLIGDHTLNHPYLAKQTKEEEKNQIISAKNVIEQYLGREVRFFAYPYGSANTNAKEILKENGFLGAVTTVPGNPQCKGLPYELSRVRIGASSLSRYGF